LTFIVLYFIATYTMGMPQLKTDNRSFTCKVCYVIASSEGTVQPKPTKWRK